MGLRSLAAAICKGALPSLRKLHLTGTGVSDEGLATLQSALSTQRRVMRPTEEKNSPMSKRSTGRSSSSPRVGRARAAAR